VYQVDIVSSGLAIVRAKRVGALSIKKLMPLATEKYSGNIFQFMKLEE
jgi:hypothetical protein